ncbi:hypothetical protein U1Q18_047624, partial [Sarracenia purpurea var. burkii]
HSGHVLEPRIKRLTNRVHNETNLPRLIGIHYVPTIENESRRACPSHVVYPPAAIEDLVQIWNLRNGRRKGRGGATGGSSGGVT